MKPNTDIDSTGGKSIELPDALALLRADHEIQRKHLRADLEDYGRATSEQIAEAMAALENIQRQMAADLFHEASIGTAARLN